MRLKKTFLFMEERADRSENAPLLQDQSDSESDLDWQVLWSFRTFSPPERLTTSPGLWVRSPWWEKCLHDLFLLSSLDANLSCDFYIVKFTPLVFAFNIKRCLPIFK